MRPSLFYDPRVLIERLALAFQRRRRLQRLRGTPAANLGLGHVDSLELLEMLSPAPRVVYDIGANVGTWTCLAKSLFPDAIIEAFEPLAQHEPGFRKWTAPWPKDVRLHLLALGSHEGRAELRVTDFSDASSLLPLASEGRQEFHIEEARRESVRVATLDGLLAAADIAPPDLIKLDVQGYELEVLRGGEKCLAHCRAILCEVSFRCFYEGQPLFGDVLDFLESRGFALHAFGSSLTIGKPLVQADALFIRST